MYGRKTSIEESNERNGLHTLLYRKYYVDELYQGLFVRGSRVVAYFWMYVDRFIIEGGAAAVTYAVKRFGQAGVKLQSGQVQTYSTVAFSGLVVVLLLIAVLGGYF